MTNSALQKFVRDTQRAYIQAKAAHDATMDLVNSIKAEELRANVYLDEDTQDRILNPGHDFCMSESDFRNYLQALYPRYLAAGFEVDSYEYAPQYPAEKGLREAERAILDAVFDTAPRHVRAQLEPLRKVQYLADVRTKMIDLFMRMNPATIKHSL